MIVPGKIINAIKHLRGKTVSSVAQILLLGLGGWLVWYGLNHVSYLFLAMGMVIAAIGFAFGKIYIPEWSLVTTVQNAPENIQKISRWIRAFYYLGAYRLSMDPGEKAVKEERPAKRVLPWGRKTIRPAAGPRPIPEELIPTLVELDRILTGKLGQNAFLASAILCGALGLGCIVLDRFSALGALLWGLSMISIMLAAAMHDGLDFRKQLRTARVEYRSHRWAVLAEICMVVLLTVIAFYLRASYLEQFPLDMHGDESEFSLVSLAISNHAENRLPPFTTGWLDHPALFNYLQAGSMDLFGRTETGARMISVLFGTACIPLMYWIGRKAWGRVAGFTAAWLLTVSALQIQFSRRALNNMGSTFFLILMMLFLYGAYLDAEKRKESGSSEPWKWGWFAGMGVVIGLAQYMYFGSHVLPIIAGLLLLILLVKRLINFKQIAILALAGVLSFGPLMYSYIQNPGSFIGRMHGVSFLSENYIQNTMGPNVSWEKTPLLVLGIQLQRNLGYFIKSGDSSNFYSPNLPQFDTLSEILFWLGLALALLRIRHFREQAVLSWFFLGVFTAGMMTSFPPNGARLSVIAPSIFLFAGFFVQYCLGLFESIRWMKPWVTPAALSVIAVATLAVNFNTYFLVYGSAGGDLVSTYLARAMRANCGDHIYLMTPGDIDVHHGTIQFLAKGCATDIKSPDNLPAGQSDGRLTRVLTLEHFQALLEELQDRYPNGTLILHNNPEGNLVIEEYVFDQNSN